MKFRKKSIENIINHALAMWRVIISRQYVLITEKTVTGYMSTGENKFFPQKLYEAILLIDAEMNSQREKEGKKNEQ